MKSLLLLSFVAVASADISKVSQIQLKVADANDAGMNHLFGQVEFEFCITPLNGTLACCNTGDLDNFFKDDFEDGEVSSFYGDNLGGCENWQHVSGKEVKQVDMTIQHWGSDGARFDWVKVFSDQGFFKCYFHKFLDGDSTETGINCQHF